MVVNKTFSFFTLSLPYMIEFAIFSILQQMALGIALAIPSSLKKKQTKNSISGCKNEDKETRECMEK